jgi:peptidoglycan/xylan/chitin deacetylase (PgdA/CDA1 family)
MAALELMNTPATGRDAPLAALGFAGAETGAARLRSGVLRCAKSAFAFLSYASGLNAIRKRLARAVCGPRLVVLAYHRVNDLDSDTSPYTVAPRQFEEHVRYAKDRFHVITFAEALRMRSSRDAAEDCLVITFDDGFRDNFTNAAPILERHGVRACLFLTTDLVDAAPSGTQPDFSLSGMSWDEARELRDRGFELGVHARTHRNLAAMPIEDARQEILLSKARMEEMLGEPVSYFAYPGGKWRTHFNDAVRTVAGKEFSVCCTTMRGRNSLSSADMQGVHRICVHNWWSAFHFARELEGTFDFLSHLSSA